MRGQDGQTVSMFTFSRSKGADETLTGFFEVADFGLSH